MNKNAPLPVIVNRSGGTASKAGGDLADQLRKAFANAGCEIDLELVEGKDIADAVERHRSAPRVAVGGGDGTLAGAAHILAHSGAELAVLPLGTRNHFARQLGVPLDLAEAAQLAASEATTSVDIGQAGERTFINNASLGAYVDLVREREKSSLSKGLASVVAGWRILRKLRPQTLEITIDGQRESVRTAMLFIGNNRYEIPEGKPGERRALDDGLLSVFALAPLSRTAIVRAALRVVLGRPDMRRDFALERTAREVMIEGKGEIGIALDGERVSLPLPLTLAVRPRALKVVAPHA
jgi:diacylglycerol kinase family enzyme